MLTFAFACLLRAAILKFECALGVCCVLIESMTYRVLKWSEVLLSRLG